MSLLNNKAGVISRNADFLGYSPTLGDIDVMNRQAVGSVTISQTSKGFYEPNVQSAINDVHSLSILPINSIVINSDGISPEGQSQVDDWIFTGTVSNESDPVGTEVIIPVFGFPVKALVGDNAEEFATKVKTSLAEAVTNRMAINSYTDHPTDGNTIQVTYIDNQAHNLESYYSYGITISASSVSPSKPGYGDWSRIGAQTITFDGSSDQTILYYFKRIA